MRLAKEVELYSQAADRRRPAPALLLFRRRHAFVLERRPIAILDRQAARLLPWDKAAEVTFECEPGTLQQHKLEALKEIGVTRLSLGVENFDDKILEANGRAHLSQEVYRSYEWVQGPALRPGQHRLDRRHGGRELGQLARVQCARPSSWRRTASPIYQMELPFNTVFSKELPEGIADWPTKRDWVQYAFDSWPRQATRRRVPTRWSRTRPAAGLFIVTASGTAPTCSAREWRRSATSAASTCRTSIPGSSILRMLDKGELPLGRALPVTPRQLLIREMILQLKTGATGGRLFSPEVRRRHFYRLRWSFWSAKRGRSSQVRER